MIINPLRKNTDTVRMSKPAFSSLNKRNQRTNPQPQVRIPDSHPAQFNPTANPHNMTSPNSPQRFAGYPIRREARQDMPPRPRPWSVSSQQPSSGQFDDAAAFPPLSSTSPRVSLPQRPDRHTLVSGPKSNGHDLENEVRQMLLKNGASSSQSPNNDAAASASPQAAQVQTGPRKLNQRERKEQLRNTHQMLSTPSSNQNAPHYRNTTGPPRSFAGNAVRGGQAPFNSRQHVPPYLQSHQLAPHPGSQQNFVNPPMDPNSRPRPRVQHPTLFNPHAAIGSSRPHPSYGQSQQYPAGDQQQLSYLGSIVESEAMKAQIGGVELMVKDQLKHKLEQICRKEVSEFEHQTTPDFESQTVTLESFGSLATNFATKNSDMDLVLLSPNSALDPSKSESPVPRIIEKVLLDQGYGVRLLTQTRVPIIKLCDSPDSKLLGRLRHARELWEHGKDPEAEVETEKKTTEEAADGADALKQHDESSPNKTLDASAQGIAGNGTSSITEVPPNGVDDNTPATQILQSQTKSIAEENAKKKDDDMKEEGLRLELERDDPSLESKSDEERVRLYRLAMKEEWYTPSERGIIFNFIRSIENSKPDTTLISTHRAALGSLPNVLRRYRPLPVRKLEFPKSGVGVQCDINFSNRLAIHNSALLRCYSYCDPRVRTIVLFIKAWAKRRRINSAYESSLSSYGYVLMVLHYLVNVADPPVVPNLQHFFLSDDPTHLNGPKVVDGHKVHFYRDEAGIQDLASQDQLSWNKASIAQLVRGFFAYYGSNQSGTFVWTRDVLSLRTVGGIISKKSKGWVAARTDIQAGEQAPENVGAGGVAAAGGRAGAGEKAGATDNKGGGKNKTPIETKHNPPKTKEIRQRYLVAIEDPFETEHNVGRTVSHEGICLIRDEFRRAHRLIIKAGRGGLGMGKAGDAEVENLMAEAPERGDLRYRFFGPNPNRGGRRGGDSKAIVAEKKQPEQKGKEQGLGQGTAGTRLGVGKQQASEKEKEKGGKGLGSPGAGYAAEGVVPGGVGSRTRSGMTQSPEHIRKTSAGGTGGRRDSLHYWGSPGKKGEEKSGGDNGEDEKEDELREVSKDDYTANLDGAADV